MVVVEILLDLKEYLNKETVAKQYNAQYDYNRFIVFCHCYAASVEKSCLHMADRYCGR